ncbi:hypothetical protein O181_001450 [Austropuccinia psidii MF-1]|uniref:Uncharacterized protein n=1 Tax=Austropuccinia psidii MF-1 TaxID=1389203 RepID=A0A9Q3BAL5_9BASI|nr:hypothetical protein [Austropuccinia psidii MF-1]
MPDGLPRRPKGEHNEESERYDLDEEEYCIKPPSVFGLKEVNTSKVEELSINKSKIEIPLKQEGFGKHMQEYSDNFQKPQSIGEEHFIKIKRKSVNCYLEGWQLKRRNKEHSKIVL